MDAVCRDFESAPLDDRWKAMFRYLSKVNDAPASVSQADVDAVKAAGWTEEGIYVAATVCAVFNFFNRWIDATGVEDAPAGFYEAHLQARGDLGYAM